MPLDEIPNPDGAAWWHITGTPEQERRIREIAEAEGITPERLLWRIIDDALDELIESVPDSESPTDPAAN